MISYILLIRDEGIGQIFFQTSQAYCYHASVYSAGADRDVVFRSARRMSVLNGYNRHIFSLSNRVIIPVFLNPTTVTKLQVNPVSGGRLNIRLWEKISLQNIAF